ncbi:MAG TPA: molybdopterin dinucleotide binding domain-containing protein, partial [Solirubrobacterales bacterium]|nr:molybdopterin dinucleotide binding domain-containing protein [Solirubrobacterales bacterium]
TDIGGRGVRWQDINAPQASTGTPSERFADEEPSSPEAPANPRPFDEVPSEEGVPVLALGTYRDLWAGPITELNPPLKFLTPHQRLEISPQDARRLDLKNGEAVRVSQNGSALTAAVLIKERVSPGTAFMAEGVAEANANALLNGGPVQVKIEKLSEARA